MNIIVNDTIENIPQGASISQMLKDLSIDINGIAVAVNDSVVSKSSWDETIVKENDNILIIKASQGG